MPPRSDHVDQLSLQQCLSRLAAGLRGVREGALTSAEEVDVCTPIVVEHRLPALRLHGSLRTSRGTFARHAFGDLQSFCIVIAASLAVCRME